MLSAIVDSEDRRGLLYLSCHCSKLSDKKGGKGARIYSDSRLREYSPSRLHRHEGRRAMKNLREAHPGKLGLETGLGVQDLRARDPFLP